MSITDFMCPCVATGRIVLQGHRRVLCDDSRAATGRLPSVHGRSPVALCADLVRSLASLTMLTTVEDRELVRATELVRLAIEALTPSARSGDTKAFPG